MVGHDALNVGTVVRIHLSEIILKAHLYACQSSRITLR